MNHTFTSDSRAFVVHLRDEHRRLNEATRDLESELAEQALHSARKVNKNVTDSLRRLRNRLAQHFLEEEEGGCIEEAVARCPTLSTEAFNLEHEHRDLLAELDQLIAQSGEQPELPQLATRYQTFATRLRIHEAHENKLLERGFNVSME